MMGRANTADDTKGGTARLSVGFGPRVMLLSTLLPAMAAIAVGGLIVARFDRALIEQQTSDLMTHLRAAAARWRLMTDALRQDTVALTAVPPIHALDRLRTKQTVDGDDADIWRARLSTIYRSAMLAKPHYLQIRLIGVADGGREIVRVERDEAGAPPRVVSDAALQRKGHRGYFEAGLATEPNEVYLSPISLNRDHGRIAVPHRPTYRAATAVRDQSGVAFGVLVVNVDFSHQATEISRDLPPGATFYMTDDDGHFLVHPEPGAAFAHELGAPRRIQSEIAEVAKWFTSHSSTTTLTTGELEPAVTVLHRVALDPVHPTRRLLLGLSVPRSAVLSRSSDARQASLLVGGACLAACMLVGLVLARGMVKPLQRITRAVRGFGERGRMTGDLPTDEPGEAGLLARSFAEMTRRVVEHTSALEREIGARQQAELEVEQAIARLREVNEELKTFTYTVSHDLRAPLRAIEGFGRVLSEMAEQWSDDSAKQYLERIRAATERMSEQVEGLLELSRIDDAELVGQPIDLAEAARAAFDEQIQAYPGRDVTFSVADGLAAHGDPRLLRSALDNLIGNALKYSQHVAQPRVEVGASSHDGRHAFFVRDNGAGFDMRHADKLFAPFQRLHSEREFPGVGIGLATVSRIVRRHGGAIWAEGQPGAGATFWFTLPTATESERPRSDPSRPRGPSHGPGQHSEQHGVRA